MEQMKDKIVGILGGVGPEATAELFRKVIKATAVKNDQEHLRIIIDNNPQIPTAPWRSWARARARWMK